MRHLRARSVARGRRAGRLRSQAGLTVAPFMDEVVLVLSADHADVRASGQLRDAVIDAGGRCAGLFCNRVALEAPKFLRGALP